MNPFSPQLPVTPQFFVNRSEIIGEFKKKLIASGKSKPPRPDNMAVLGDWGVGKTSVLQKLEQYSLEQKETKVFTAIIALTPESCSNFLNFSLRTRDEIERSFKASDMSLLAKLKKQFIPEWRLKTLELGIVGVERKKKDVSVITAFEDALLELWNMLSKNGVDVAVLMFDDLHYMAQYHPNGLYDIRGIFQSLPRKGCNFMLTITGMRYLFSMAREFAEPFARFFDRFYLENFGIEETKDFITKPLSLAKLNLNIEKETIQRIYELTQGHPFFLSFIMKNLIELSDKRKISLELFTKIYPVLTKRLAKEKFDDDVSQITDSEQKILSKMAFIKNDIITPKQLKIENARTYLKLLTEKKGLVVKTKRGEYSLYHPLFKQYLKNIK